MNRQPSELERTVAAWRTKGLAWCECKLVSDQLDKDRESFLAAIIGDFRKFSPEDSEAKLKADALASDLYRDYLRGMVLAAHKTAVARVEFDALKELFSARQSDQSLLREQLSKGVYYAGG